MKTKPPHILEQLDLLTRFGAWTGRRPRGQWFTNPEGERQRSTGSDQRLQMAYWLNSESNPVQLKRRVEDQAMLQWYHRNRMPPEVRAAIEWLLSQPTPDPKFDGFRLKARHAYVPEKSIRLDMSSPGAADRLRELQLITLKIGDCT